MKHTVSAALAASTILTSPFVATSAFAQEQLTLDEIIISGSLSPVEATKTGATVEKIEGEALESPAKPLLEDLSALPGVSYSQDGGVGGTGTLRVRGLPARYIGVRINGIDVTDTSQPQTQFDFGGRLSFGNASVELVKGSQSALYGSEAVAGVINITTALTEPGTTISVEAGSYNTYAAGLSSTLISEGSSLSYSLSHFKTDGFSAQDSNDEDDGYENTSFTFAWEQDVSDALTVGLSGLYRTAEGEYDGFSTLDATNSQDEKGARLFARLNSAALTQEFSLSLFDVEREYDDGAVTPYDGLRREFAYLATADLSAASTLTFGAEYTEESFSVGSVSGSDDNTALKGEWLFAPTGDLDLSLALRYDDHSEFGDHISGRLAAAWQMDGNTTLRAVLGTGFRAPSLYERNTPSGGNPDLKEETSQSAELGIERRFGGDSFVKATLFYTELEDLIDYEWQGQNPCRCYTQVDGTTTSKGVELSGAYALSEQVGLTASYTYTDAKTEGVRLVRVPRHDLVLGVNAEISDRLATELEWNYVADFAALEDYTLLNAGVTYQINDATALYLRAENLLDEDYQTSPGYNTAGRSAYVGLRASF